jgi:hypothetical protein
MGMEQVGLVVLYTLALRWFLFCSKPAETWDLLIHSLDLYIDNGDGSGEDSDFAGWIRDKVEGLTLCAYCQTLWTVAIVLPLFCFHPVWSGYIFTGLLAAYVAFHIEPIMQWLSDPDTPAPERILALIDFIRTNTAEPKEDTDKPILSVVTSKKEEESPWTDEESK